MKILFMKILFMKILFMKILQSLFTYMAEQDKSVKQLLKEIFKNNSIQSNIIRQCQKDLVKVEDQYNAVLERLKEINQKSAKGQETKKNNQKGGSNKKKDEQGNSVQCNPEEKNLPTKIISLSELIQIQIDNFLSKNSSKLTNLKDYQKTESNDFLIQIIVVFMLGIYVSFDGKKPRTTQLVCLWMNIHHPKIILEIKTGEGKTMIVALTALYFAIRGKKVDVLTSSSSLAMTQTSSSSSVYKLFRRFNISLGSNCDTNMNPKQIYRCQVIYGTSFSFQADYLKKRFSGIQDYFIGRNFDINHALILDEVDALLIDRMRDSTRLSSQKPLYDYIRYIFRLIYQVKQQLKSAKLKWGGQMKVKILQQQIEIPTKQFDSVNEELDFIQKEKKQVYEIIINGIQQTNLKTMFPSYLMGSTGYIQLMLKIWIQSCYQSVRFKENVDYIINRAQCQIVPIDVSTGNFQPSTKWQNGIHQFVEMRERFEPSVDTIVSNYESNLIYFQRYSYYLIGLTGTISKSLGVDDLKQKSTIQRFISEQYKTDIIKIPTAKVRKLKIQYPRLYTSEAEWKVGLQTEAQKECQNRMVLIIFKTILEAKNFIKSMEERPIRIKELYDHFSYHQDLEDITNEIGTIIVSTNLGGRGTDISITDRKILDNGGLHVMLTYRPTNWRIEEQAFGRAGRNGQPGSGAFYIYLPEAKQAQSDLKQKFNINLNQNQTISLDIERQLNKHRNQAEQSYFQSSKITVQNEKAKKQLLDRFFEKYIRSQISRISQLQQIVENQQRIIIKCSDQLIQKYLLQLKVEMAQEQWALFLKKNIKSAEGNQPEQQIKIDFNSFVTSFESNFASNSVNPGFYSLYGSKLLEVSIQEAKKLFIKCREKHYDWINEYFLLYIDMKENQGQISQGYGEDLNAKIKNLTTSMLTALSLYVSIASKDENQKKISKFFNHEIENLLTIASTIKGYHKKGLDLIMRVNLQSNRHSLDNLAVRGFNFSIHAAFERKKEEEQSGFWATLWKVVKVIVLAVAAIVTVVKICQNPALMIPGCRVLGGIANAITSIFQGSDSSVDLQLENIKQRSQQVSKLVRITGDYAISKETQQKIQNIRQKYEQKNKEIETKFDNIKVNIDQTDFSKDKQNLKDIKKHAFSNFKYQSKKAEQSTAQSAADVKNASEIDKENVERSYRNLCTQTVNAHIDSNINPQLKKAQQQRKKKFEVIQKTRVQFHQQMNKNLLNFAKQKMTKCQQESYTGTMTPQKVQAQYDARVKQVPIIIQKYDTKINNKQTDITIDLLVDEQSQNQIQQDCLKKLEKMVNEGNAMNDLSKETQQLLQIINNNQNTTNLLEFDRKIIKYPKNKETIEKIQQQIKNKMKNKIQQTKINHIRKNQEQKLKDILKKADQSNVQLTQRINMQLTSPIQKFSQINEPCHYKTVINAHSIKYQTQFKILNNEKQFYNCCEQFKEKKGIFLYQKLIAFVDQKNKIIKNYGQRKAIQKDSQKYIKIKGYQYYQNEKSNMIGKSVIGDLKAYFSETKMQRISQTSHAQNMSDDDVRQIYVNSFILTAIPKMLQQKEYQKLRTERQNQWYQMGLKKQTLPFQLRDKMLHFKYDFLNQINKVILKENALIQRYKYLVSSEYKEIENQQKEKLRNQNKLKLFVKEYIG